MKAPDLALIGFVAIIIIILAFAAVVLWQVWAGTIKLDGLIAELDPARPADYGKGKPFPLSVPALHLRGRRTVPAAFDRNRSFHPRPRRRARTDRDQQRHLRRLEGRVEPSEQT
jgi:hypothetical protein